MDFKKNWQGWERKPGETPWDKPYIWPEERTAIIYAGSYRRLNELLQEAARKECVGGKKPFYIGSTWWSPGLAGYKEAHYHDDYMLEGQMRATKIHATYFAYERTMEEGPRSLKNVADPVLESIVRKLNECGGDAWPFTLALLPVKIRSEAWQQHPAFKRIAEAFASDISVYLENLEAIQKAYEYH